MRIHFFEPPAAQRIGGLDAAIHSLRNALRESGVPVDDSLPTANGGDDIAHFHGLWQPAHARLARECLARRIPYLVSPHGMLEPWAWRHKRWKKWPYFHLVEKAFLTRAAALLATAQPEADRLQHMIPSQRIATLPLGLSGRARPDYLTARAALGWREDEQIFLFLSRLHVKKGVEMLLHALASGASPQRGRLVIVGGGEPAYVRSLHALAAKLAPRLPPIGWLGEVWGEERWKYFQGADLFCLPTHSENFGLAVLEACQVGTPVLTTTTTPWAQHLATQRAYICEPAMESVAAALARFFTDGKSTPAQRGELAAWTHAHFAWSELAPRYVALYDDVIRQSARGS